MLNRKKNVQFFNSCYVFLCKILIVFYGISIPYGAIIYANIQNVFRNTKFFAYYFLHFTIDIYQFRL